MSADKPWRIELQTNLTKSVEAVGCYWLQTPAGSRREVRKYEKVLSAEEDAQGGRPAQWILQSEKEKQMFYFRINKVRIIDNRESGFLFFRRDLAEIKLISLITTGDVSFPDLDSFLQETDAEKKRELAAAMVAQVVSNRILATVDNVKDGQTITFGDTGYVVFQADTIPQDFNWCFIALEDDGDVRDFGTSIDEVSQNKGFDGFVTNLATLVGAASNPAFTAGVAVAKFVAEVVAANLKKKEDDLAGLLYMSLNRQEHYLHGERKKDKVADLTGNMLVDYSLFAF